MSAAHRATPSTTTRIKTALAAGLAAVMAAAGLVAGGTAALADTDEPAPITGTVHLRVAGFDQTEPAPAGDVVVTPYLLDGSGMSATKLSPVTVGEGGVWSVDADPGRYAFHYDYVGDEANRADHFGYHSIATLEEAIHNGSWLFADHSSASPLQRFATIEYGAIVTGHVSAVAGGASLANQPVDLYRDVYVNGERSLVEIATTKTASNGTYEFDAVASGSYTLGFGGASGYARHYLGGAVAVENAQTFSADTTDWEYDFPRFYEYDAALQRGGKLIGTVKDTAGKTLKGIDVAAFMFDGGWWSWVQVGVAKTTASGAYTFDGLIPGDYRIGASGSVGSTSYTQTYYKNTRVFDDAATVAVQGGKTKSGINLSLAKGGTITGTVSLPGGGHPAAADIWIGVCAEAIHCASEFAVDASDYDPATGAYRIAGVPSGTYSVLARAWAGNVVSTFVGGATVSQWDSAARIKVTAGSTVSGQDVVLGVGATIAGTVTDADGPVADVHVRVYRDAKTEGSLGDFQSAWTDEDGEYTVVGLEAGRYVVEAVPAYDSSLATAWAGNAFTLKAAERFELATGGARPGVDFSLVPSGAIEVTMRDADSNALEDVEVALMRYRVAGGSAVDHTEWRRSGEDGTFLLANLAPGEYTLWHPGDTGAFAESWYGGDSAATATRILVEPGVTTPIEYTLDRAGAYEGRVVDPDGNPVSAWVELYSSEGGYLGVHTDDDGYFSVARLEEVAHEVTVSVDGGGTGLVRYTRFTAPAPSFNAEPVDLGEIEVARGGTISGKVLGSDGKALKNVGVVAYSRIDGDLWWFEDATTGKDGGFTVTGLPVGAVYLEFNTWSKYGTQSLGGSPQLELSDPVIIESADDHVYREARLVTGGSISGTVTNKATGKPVAGASVAVHTQGQQYQRDDETDKKGKYMLPGLEAGGYVVGINTYGSDSPWNAYTAEERNVLLGQGKNIKLNAALTARGKVTGKVTDQSGKAIADTIVRASNVADPGWVVDAWTQPNGTYSMHLDAGTWTIQFRDSDDTYLPQFLGGGDAAGAKVTVANGKTVSGKNATLSRAGGGSIWADVRADDTEDPIGMVTLERIESGGVVSSLTYPREAVSWGLGWVNCVLDDCMPIENVIPGTYRLRILGATVKGWNIVAYYDEVVTDEFEVVAGETTSLGTIDLGASTPASDRANVAVIAPEIIAYGPVQVGTLLEATEGEWKYPAEDFYYQWMRDGKAIPGATGRTYILTPGDAGAIVSASVMPNGYWTPPVQLDEPVAKGEAAVLWDAPVISGQTASGKTIKVSTGEWDLPGLDFTYQWQRDGAPIAKATSASYKLTKTDVGTDVSVVVTARRAGFESASTTVDADEIVPGTAMKQTKASKVTTHAAAYSVTAGTWSPSGATVSYEWFVWENGVTPTSVGTGATLTSSVALAITDPLTVRVTASKAGYTSTTVEYVARRGPKPVVTGEVTANAPMVGVPIVLDWDGAEVSPTSVSATYQWFKNGKAISGAKSATYTPKVADAGASIAVKVTLKDPRHAAWTAADAITVTAGTVAAAGTITPGAVAIVDNDRPYVGRTLSASPGAWSPSPTKFTYQWKRDGVAIPKATKATYKLVAADAGTDITVEVRGVLGTQNATATSPSVEVSFEGPVMVTDPYIVTPAKVGAPLTAKLGTWDIKPTSISYQWLLNEREIPGATKATYTPVVRDLGEYISLRVTAKLTGSPATTYTVEPVTIERGAAAKSTTAPSLKVAGKAATSTKLGKTVVGSTGSWSAGAIGYRYQWQVMHPGDEWTAIEGATRPSLFLDRDADAVFVVGSSYRLVVTAVRSGYLDGVAYSKAIKITG